MTAPKQAYRAAFILDQGLQRENNEDQVLFLEDRGAFAVIDGVGGHRAGEKAALIAKTKLGKALSHDRLADPETRLRHAIAITNNAIFESAQEEPAHQGMACVLTAILLEAGKITIGHVGDTRLYKLDRRGIHQITHDHSPVGEQEAARMISEEEAMRHPRRNEIFRDVGTEQRSPDSPEFIDIYKETLEPDTAILLCSDGLTDLVTSREILKIVRHQAGQPQHAVLELVDEANAKGGKDNISIVLVEGLQFANQEFASVAQEGASEAETPPSQANVSGSYPMVKSENSSFWSKFLPSFLRREAEEKPSDEGLPFDLASAETEELRPVRQEKRSSWKPFAALLGLGLLLVLLFQFGPGLATLRKFIPTESPPAETPKPQTLVVDLNTGYTSIQAAISDAKPGDTIEVAAGEYSESVELKNDITLRSVEPRGAVICHKDGGPGTAEESADFVAFRANEIQNARLIGFHIRGGAECSLKFGLDFTDSVVHVEGLEISGASEAAIQLSGLDTSIFRLNYLHANPQDGFRVTGDAAPRIHDNLVTGSGRAAIYLEAESSPTIANNRLRGNTIGIMTATDLRRDEFLQWNEFGQATEEDRHRLISEPER